MTFGRILLVQRGWVDIVYITSALSLWPLVAFFSRHVIRLFSLNIFIIVMPRNFDFEFWHKVTRQQATLTFFHSTIFYFALLTNPCRNQLNNKRRQFWEGEGEKEREREWARSRARKRERGRGREGGSKRARGRERERENKPSFSSSLLHSFWM